MQFFMRYFTQFFPDFFAPGGRLTYKLDQLA